MTRRDTGRLLSGGAFDCEGESRIPPSSLRAPGPVSKSAIQTRAEARAAQRHRPAYVSAAMGAEDPQRSPHYDRIVYYVAPAALVAAILFCCFRIALVYYMQIRWAGSEPRPLELQAAPRRLRGAPADRGPGAGVGRLPL